MLEPRHLVPKILKVGFLHRVHELALELSGHTAKLTNHLPDLAQHARQVLGRDEDKRHDADDQQLAGVEIEHRGA